MAVKTAWRAVSCTSSVTPMSSGPPSSEVTPSQVKRARRPSGVEFEVGEPLLFAEDVVVAAAGEGDEQPEGEAQLRAVQELPGAVGSGEVDEGAGGAVEFQAQGVIGEDDGSHGGYSL